MTKETGQQLVAALQTAIKRKVPEEKENMGSIRFDDADGQGPTTIHVRALGENVGLSVRIDHDGDYDCNLPTDSAQRLMKRRKSGDWSNSWVKRW